MTLPIVRDEGCGRRSQRCPSLPEGPALLWPKVKLLGQAWRLTQGASSIPRRSQVSVISLLASLPEYRDTFPGQAVGVGSGPEVSGEARVWQGRVG